jgi:hypothetical protein
MTPSRVPPLVSPAHAVNSAPTRADTARMAGLTVTRWRRYGKDRLYVSAEDGTRVGWLDVTTGERTLERDELREAFERALAEHELPAAAAVAAPEPAPPPTPPPATPPPTAQPMEPYALRITRRDLGVNKAGQAAREQAVAHRRAAPVQTLAARVRDVHTDERAWRIGADGEEKVAARLGRLPESWKVLHALPVGSRGSDIDHLVVGPGGVFTINTKHHPDASIWVGGNTFMVNGHRQPYVRNARHEAERAAKLLSPAVGFAVRTTGVIAVVGAHKGFNVKRQPEGVHVVGRKQLAAWLCSLAPALFPDEVDRIYRVARRSDTWQPARPRSSP